MNFPSATHQPSAKFWARAASPKVPVSSISYRRTSKIVSPCSRIAYDGFTAYAENRPLLAWRNHAVHAKHRLPWSRGLNTNALKEYDPVLADRVSQLVDVLLTDREATVNITEKLRFFS